MESKKNGQITAKQRRLLGKQGARLVPDIKSGKISAPVAVSIAVKGRPPVLSTRNNNTVVTHREYVSDVSNSSGVLVNNSATSASIFRINPSNGRVFNWLSSIAGSYDSYRFTRVRVSYVPYVGTNTSGRFYLGWDSDSQDAISPDRSSLANFAPTVESTVWDGSELVIPVDKEWRFVEDTNITSRKLVDLGQLVFATWGGNDNTTCGELYISYSVELRGPQPPSGLIQVGRVDVPGVLTFTGPAYVPSSDVSVSSTGLSFNLSTAGTYALSISLVATTAGALVVGGNSTLLGVVKSQFASSVGLYMCVVRSTGGPSNTSSVSVSSLTGLSQATLFVARGTTSAGLT